MEGFTQSHKRKVDVKFKLALAYDDNDLKHEWERPFEFVPIDRFVNNTKPLLDHYLNAYCDISGGFFIDADGEPWIDECDSFFWLHSWFSGLTRILENCPRSKGKFSDEYPRFDLGLEDLFQPRIFGSYFNIITIDLEEKIALRHKHSDLDHEFAYLNLKYPAIEVLLEEHARLTFGLCSAIGKHIGDFDVIYYPDEIWIINALTSDRMSIKGFGGPEDFAVCGYPVHIMPWEQSEMRLYCYKDEVNITDIHTPPYWVPMDDLIMGFIREGRKLSAVAEEIKSILQDNQNYKKYSDGETSRNIQLIKESFSEEIGRDVDHLSRAYEKWKIS